MGATKALVLSYRSVGAGWHGFSHAGWAAGVGPRHPGHFRLPGVIFSIVGYVHSSRKE